jgi:hypothetical protein
MTAGIIKRSEQEFADWITQEWGFLAGLASVDGQPLRLEPVLPPSKRDS